MIKELAKKNRSYRRFYENKKITEDELKELVDTGSNTASAANRQPVRYKLVCDEVMNEKVFECLGWAGYLKDWAGPVKGERPSSYIIMATDKMQKRNVMRELSDRQFFWQQLKKEWVDVFLAMSTGQSWLVLLAFRMI